MLVSRNTLGRKDTLNLFQVDFLWIDRGTLFARYRGEGAASPVSTDPVVQQDVIQAALADPAFVDLRSPDGSGHILNMAAITHVDVDAHVGIMFCGFASTGVTLKIPRSKEAILDAALATYTGPGGGAGVVITGPALAGKATAGAGAPTSLGLGQGLQFSGAQVQIDPTFVQTLIQQEADVQYARLIDSTNNDSIMYIGEAAPGSLTSAAVWRIKKVTFVAEDTSITWASGSAAFDKIWDNRLALSYL